MSNTAFICIMVYTSFYIYERFRCWCLMFINPCVLKFLLWANASFDFNRSSTNNNFYWNVTRLTVKVYNLLFCHFVQYIARWKILCTAVIRVYEDEGTSPKLFYNIIITWFSLFKFSDLDSSYQLICFLWESHESTVSLKIMDYAHYQ